MRIAIVVICLTFFFKLIVNKEHVCFAILTYIHKVHIMFNQSFS